jgi:hypothetical protein
MVAFLDMDTDTLIRRMEAAVEIVENRLKRATAALDAAGVDYAVIGGNAVRTWVAKVNLEAMRNTRDVDILIRRSDLEAATKAMEGAGFLYRKTGGMTAFLDGPNTKLESAVHVLFANERVRSTDICPIPDVTEYEPSKHFRVLKLESLVRMKLTSYRIKDQTHLIDLFDIGLIDETWISRFDGETAERLRAVIEQAKRERLPGDNDPNAMNG